MQPQRIQDVTAGREAKATGETSVLISGLCWIYHMAVSEPPKVGMRWNIRSNMGLLPAGLYRVQYVKANYPFRDALLFACDVSRIGDLADDMPVHDAVCVDED